MRITAVLTSVTAVAFSGMENLLRSPNMRERLLNLESKLDASAS